MIGDRGSRCESCDATYDSRAGILDLTSVDDPIATPHIAPEKFDEVNTAVRGEETWPQLIRNFARTRENTAQVLYESTAYGRTALKLLLRLPQHARVLEIGCGTGLVASTLAPLVSSVCGIDVDPSLLLVARRRVELEALDKSISLVLFRSSKELPFDDDSFDCVLLSSRVACSKNGVLTLTSSPPLRLGPLSDVRRVLKRGGQIFWLGKNRLSYERLMGGGFLEAVRGADLTHSSFGYRRLLKATGFSEPTFFEMSELKSFLVGIRPLQRASKHWTAAPVSTIKNRIKRHEQLVPMYGISASNGPSDEPTLLGELLSVVARSAGERHRLGSLRVEDFRVSRKDKAILVVTNDDDSWIVRVPLSPAAELSDARNASMIQSFENREDISRIVPQSIARGTHRGLSYFVETRLPGTAISGLLRESDPESFFDQASELLALLNRGDARLTRLDGERFEHEIVERLTSVKPLLERPADVERLNEYFARRLKGMELPFGTVHGDFSVSNILVNDRHRVTGLLDWEDGDDDGLLGVDAINFVESLRRSTTTDQVGVVIPQLAAGRFTSKREKRFLRQHYDQYGINSSAHEPLVYFKWLRHIAYLQRFWLRFDSVAIQKFVRPVVDSILRQG